jgi:hypothetical protein
MSFNKIFMKLNQLMLAPVALGMIAPVAANAADLNIAAVNQYSSEQVTSVSQLSDVQPSDWAYQALTNLVDRYGCVAGYPNGTYGGGKAMTRYEAAALLNACLDRVTEVTDELQRLSVEFREELAVIRGRVDKLEAKVGQLEATQFSTTTKLKGEAYFTLNGVDDAYTKTGAGTAASNVGHTAFNYDLRLNLDTSFTGKDLFRTRLRAGNFSSQPFGSSSSLFKLDKATNTSDAVKLDRLYYQFPALAKGITLTAGAIVENHDMFWKPSAYGPQILDFFTGTAGAPGVFNKAEGAGFGVQYVQPGKKGGVIAGVNYVAQSGSDSTKGVFDENGGINLQAQLGYRAPQYGAAFSYRYGTEGTRMRNFNAVNGGSAALALGQTSNNYALNAYWQPKTSGIIPSVSGAYGWSEVSKNAAGQATPTGATNAQTWFAGLQWSDVFAKGNAAGVAVGQPGNSTAISADATMWEVFYKYRVSDNISVTPAVFYVSNNQAFQGNSSNVGGVIQTKFTF